MEYNREKNIKKLLALEEKGVNFFDIDRTDIRGKLVCGKNVYVDINCIFEGVVYLSDNVVIKSNCLIRNSKIDNNTIIESFSYIDESDIGENCSIGPYARLRPKTKLDNHIQIGNFVEIKQTSIGKNSKINHHSFIGNCDIKSNVIVGAGTITCNHDGKNHQKTLIKENVYIGSGTKLIAPLQIGKNATIGAGSVITKNVVSNKLTISRFKQQIIVDKWERPTD